MTVSFIATRLTTYGTNLKIDLESWELMNNLTIHSKWTCLFLELVRRAPFPLQAFHHHRRRIGNILNTIWSSSYMESMVRLLNERSDESTRMTIGVSCVWQTTAAAECNYAKKRKKLQAKNAEVERRLWWSEINISAFVSRATRGEWPPVSFPLAVPCRGRDTLGEKKEVLEA